MSSPERSIAILGPGLLGGSLLHDAKRLGWPDVRAYTRRDAVATEIRNQGLANLATTHLAEAIQGVSCIVLASPIGTYLSLAEEIVAAGTAEDVIVTDVGSTKVSVLAGAGATLAAAGIPFVGSHPMAGSEEKGLGASRAGLFAQATCILTPENHTPPKALERVTNLWEAVGGQVALMDAATHDAVVAKISHMPHLAAMATILAALEEDPSVAEYAAGGLRDTTRVASGDPEMWLGILMDNRPAVLASGRKLHEHLGSLLDMLESSDAPALLKALQQAKALRDARYAR
jgi:prephenate dehydrogenase